MRYKNGFFQIIHKEDGTYLKFFPPGTNGTAIDLNDILFYLHRIKLEEFDVKELKRFVDQIETEQTEYKIASQKIYPENEFMRLEVDQKKTCAIARFYPPSNQGKLITRKEIMSDLENKGIRHGIVERNIDIYLKARQFCTDFLIAKATMPIQGKDAKIIYHFEVQNTFKPTIKEDGTVDFHQIDNINHIEEGALLATLEPADLGKPGIDISGDPIKQAKVAVMSLKHGHNIHLSEDNTKMYSDIAGHVSLTGDKVFVSNTYEVPADVGTATGDIFYDGNVHVKGNVITGFKIEAKGDIIVDGVVEGATLIADGQIILRRGIQGMNKGVLISGADVVTKFIENSEVTAGGNITTDAIMHSKVQAKGDIVSTGKRGLIIGGEILSEGNISMKVAGSTMGTKTLIQIGIDPALMEEYQSIDKQIVTMTEEMEKFNRTVGMYAGKVKKGEKFPDDRKKQYQIAKKSVALLKENIENAEERSKQIREEIEAHSHGRIKIAGIAYPNVKIMIAGASYFVRSEMHHMQFVKDRALIKTMSI